MAAASRILYLHGFCSSPASWKARLLGDFLKARGLGDRLACPALPPVPLAAIGSAEAALSDAEGETTLVGSSLGGYYAAWLAEKHDLRAVLINPAVMAPELLSGLVGKHSNFHTGESFDFTDEHVNELRLLESPQVTAERYLLLVETGDEVLDYRQALQRYAGSRQIVIDGGDHSFLAFPRLLPQIIEFCGL
ncbi:MAG: esterase YqiA [Candidatus Accumulibacter sp. BA-94]|uniref:YqiA/YcfP family alpha/beta fold hydrolase n=1 Tax=Accumulibacter sp. TaxID=2053492 RepID=UPI000452AEAF|nr:YqiA/YcfP family alpha/beta fold hydrolase [Accumulibacter sp.]EXI91970.1 MAG: esterase YqiA [Candidatus Accumulibacter sp. BA-94]MBL8392063.1 esterase [Accumulibacter sp.]HRD87171.1 YqiA/YcfP family alpha/beta fold hydrolase [Accumulibacter sp.]